MDKKILFLLFSALISVLLPGFSQPEKPPVIWQVKEVHSDFIKIINGYNDEKKILADSEKAIVRLEEKRIWDVRKGNSVSISGIRNSEKELRAFVIRLLSENNDPDMRNTVSKGQQITPITLNGEIIKETPLVMLSENDFKIVINVTPHTRIVKENSVRLSDIVVGDKLRIMDNKILVLPLVSMDKQGDLDFNPNNRRLKGRPPYYGVQQNQKMLRPKDSKGLDMGGLPMPPITEKTKFNKTVISQRFNSIFGFKDPNILKPAIFSWYTNYADVMNELGGYWMEPSAIWGFHWNLIQKINKDGTYGEYNWERYDLMVKSAQAQNLQISAKINATIPQSDKLRTRQAPSLPDDIEGYCSFVKAVVERYDGDGEDDMPGLLYPIKQWKIEDEPIYPKFFTGTGSDYAKLLRHAHDSIKFSDKDAKVICAMIYALKGPLGNRNPESFLSAFYKELKKSGDRPYDIIDHHIIFLNSNISMNDRFLRIKKEIAQIKESEKKAGFKPSPFECLEMAVPFKDEKTHAQDLVKQHVFALSIGMKKVLWSGIKASPANRMELLEKMKHDPFMKTALINENNTRKLGYYSYKKMVEILNGCDLDKVKTIMDKNGKYIYEFRKNNQYIWVVWYEGRGTEDLTIKAPGGVENLKLTDSVLNKENGKDIIDNTYAFDQKKIHITNDIISVTVGTTPVYIESY